MKTLKLLTFVPATLVMSLVFNQAVLAQTPFIQINKQLPTDPLVVNGISGGTVQSNCGNITTQPSQVLQVQESLPYLRLTVEGQGQPTMLIDGPGGRFCVLADNYSAKKPELSGFWQAGNYLLYVGNLSPGKHNYALSISQQKN
ncbi:hypothetical protein PN497_15535 [Sphaerospermopsis kisseleviana CS-549]|uniref:Uncharacterized protein n=1 Tax=Sphaerospermopsis kisseleviana CS-549 TaxID=3021783 RepID=A0ABT4ZUT1_9CYAN|nr:MULTISPECIES: hypothetical protein [Sphaerospermopsis]MBC5797486.1 hypothetical protein [Sphaerospermopsis sp. LEGE 00249]MDB9442764.1 hypothetical protein [Sphaerospermopsis kisseleviana CS-549]BAZ79566.1 hypothetical protein NIES73_08110 [Sphaerospermopsis kisseleviana NIES-73]